jgi:hypothetical protein
MVAGRCMRSRLGTRGRPKCICGLWNVHIRFWVLVVSVVHVFPDTPQDHLVDVSGPRFRINAITMTLSTQFVAHEPFKADGLPRAIFLVELVVKPL